MIIVKEVNRFEETYQTHSHGGGPQELKLSQLSADALITGLDSAVQNEKKSTHIVLRYINEVSDRKLYLELGYESLYKLLTERHKYSGNQAYDRIDAVRVLKLKPDVVDKVQSGELNLTQLIKVGQCIKQGQKRGKDFSVGQAEEILEQISNKTVFETEKVLAVELDFTPKQYQKLTPQKDDSVRVTFTFTAEEFALIQKLQSAISHSVPSNDLAKAFVHLAKLHLKKIEGKAALNENTEAHTSKKGTRLKSAGEPHEKQPFETVVEETTAFSAEEETEKDSSNRPVNSANSQPTRSFLESRVFRKTKRKYISMRVRRRLLAEANNECSFVGEDGFKCYSKFCLQIDHVIPLARGGGDSIENLRVLCGFHNRVEAHRWNLGWSECPA